MEDVVEGSGEDIDPVVVGSVDDVEEDFASVMVVVKVVFEDNGKAVEPVGVVTGVDRLLAGADVLVTLEAEYTR